MVAVESTMVALGTAAPTFTLPDPSGRELALTEITGSAGTLVAFLCNHCPFVRHIAPALGTAAAGWAGRGVGVVGVNSNDPVAYPDERPDRMTEHATEWGWEFPYLVDSDQRVALAYRAACTPDFFLYDAELRLVYRGRFDAATPGNREPVTGAELGAAVDALLEGAPAPAEQLASIGCNIKWTPGNEPPWFG